jgi:hypothetical protein
MLLMFSVLWKMTRVGTGIARLSELPNMDHFDKLLAGKDAKENAER